MREKFETYIDSKLANMVGDSIDLTSGDVHRIVGGYPGTNHRMPICCDVLYTKMRGDDKIVSAPPKGKGASLTIRYFRKNHSRYREKTMSQLDFEIIWQRIVKFQGESFSTKKGLDFTYTVINDDLIPSRADFRLSKDNFRKAYSQLPVENTSDFSQDIMGTSYVYGILTDTRIAG